MGHDEPKGKKKGAISTLLTWLGVAENGEASSPSPPPDGVSKGGDGNRLPRPFDSMESVPPSAQTFSDKALMLKKSFEFEAKLAKELEAIGSAGELLLFIQDALIFRFDQLHRIGLINADSYRFIASLSDKMALMTVGATVNEEWSPKSTEELRKENAQLRQQIASDRARHRKSGIITEEDMAKDREITRLNARIRDQQSQLKIARKRIEALTSYREMVQTLRVRNGFLTSKAEQQAKLLRSLTVHNPEHERVLGAADRLAEENRQMKKDLDRQSHLLNQLRDQLQPDARAVIDELIDRNSALWDDVQNRDGQLDAAFASGRDIHDHLDELQERNYQLKQTLETTRTIDRYMQEPEGGKKDFNLVVEALKLENDRLQRSVAAKEEQIASMTVDPVSRQLMAAFSRLQQEHREIVKEKQVNDELHRQEVARGQRLMAQARERAALSKENQRLKTELESTKRLAESYKRSEQQLVQVKKVSSSLEVKYQRATVELEEARKKLARITAEYKLLMGEYENIFGKQ